MIYNLIEIETLILDGKEDFISEKVALKAIKIDGLSMKIRFHWERQSCVIICAACVLKYTKFESIFLSLGYDKRHVHIHKSHLSSPFGVTLKANETVTRYSDN